MTGSNGAGEGHGAAVRRVEDPPFLRGTRPYTDDLRNPEALYAVFVRSGFAHARVGTSTRPRRPGCPAWSASTPPPTSTSRTSRSARRRSRRPSPCAARCSRATPSASSASRSRSWSPRRAAQAVDAAQLVDVDFDPLDALDRHDQGARRRCAAAVPGIRDRQPGRRRPARRGSARGRRGARQRTLHQPAARRRADGAGRRAGRAGPGHRRLHPVDAEPGPAHPTGRRVRFDGIEQEQLRVISTATGGGFGARIATYPEQIVTVALARELGRAVRYIETRSETMLEMQHGRAQVQDVEIGGTRDGKVTGLKVRVIADCGAYPADAGADADAHRPDVVRRLRHPEGRLPLRRGRDEHDADRRLPRRRPAGGDRAGRAGDGPVRGRARHGPGRGPPAQLHLRLPAPDGHRRQLRLGRLPRARSRSA